MSVKKVIIMRGLPGCGKSRWTHRYIIERGENVNCVSADTYHYVSQPPLSDGTLVPPRYDFKPENARVAHDACFREFLTALDEQWQTIIVDNTNTSGVEIAPYYRMAELYDRLVEIVYIRAPIEKCIDRGIHDVPLATYVRMAANLWREVLPSWWKQTVIDSE